MELGRREFLKIGTGMAGVLLLRPLSLTDIARAAPGQNELAFLVDVSKCIGCWWCALACQECNGLSGAFTPDHEQPPELSPCVWTTLYTWKDGDKWKYRRQACMHCTDAACVQVCPTGAVSHHESGLVQFEENKCSGCGYCVEHCPFGVPQLEGNTITGISQMNKCIFCIDRVANGQQPACAEACPTGATTFGNRAELLEKGRQRVTELRATKPQANLYGADELGGLHVLYVLDDSPEDYGLPTDPKLPDTIMMHDVLEWLGMGALAAAVAGFGFNYMVARFRIAREGGQK